MQKDTIQNSYFDVVEVGAGITGITSALMLQKTFNNKALDLIITTIIIKHLVLCKKK